MNKITASVYWLKADEGGRSKDLPIGVRYFPIMSLTDNLAKDFLSVQLITTHIDSKRHSTVEIIPLVESEEATRIFSELINRRRFLLLEGSHIVARGMVINIHDSYYMR